MHVHTNFSSDSYITEKEIINQCKKNNIDYIALTDHGNAEGSLRYQAVLKKAGIKVIIGEELRTNVGEIIGLFLKRSIDCQGESGGFISLEKAIMEIKKQGGLVFIPHPFDKMRRGIGRENIEQFKDQIDAYEVFNSRTKLNFFNKSARKYVEENDLTPFVGSDAHVDREIGNAIIEMEDFKNKEDFLKNLKRSDTKFYTKRLKLIDIVRPTMNKITKKLKKKWFDSRIVR